MLKRNIDILLSISDDVANISDYEVLLPKIITKLCKSCGIDLIGMTVFDETRKKVGFVIATIHNIPYFNTKLWYQSFPIQSLPSELSLNSPKRVQIDANIFYPMKKMSESQEDLSQLLKGKKIAELHLIPMQVCGDLMGYLMLPLDRSAYDKIDNIYLMRVANLIASAIKNTESYIAFKHRDEEKEIQIKLLSFLAADIKGGDSYFRIMAEEIAKLIPCEFISIHSQRYFKNNFITICLIKEEGNEEFSNVSITKSVILSLVAMESKTAPKNGITHVEITGEIFDKLCTKYNYLKQLKEKYAIASILVCRFSKKDEGEINFLLGRRKPFDGKDDIFIRLWQNPDSFFLSSEIKFGTQLLPHAASVLGNFHAFEEIAVLTKKLEQEKNYLLDEINLTNNFQEIVGTSSAIQNTLSKVRQVAPLDATVLITGETGTGKELIARAVHTLSKRKDQAFITVNCATLPFQLIESELFGHEKGSFTGAFERKIGKFEIANKGTIFLDEISELPLEVQSKLLRVLQEKEFERVGGKSTIYTDIRIIAVTNRDLEKEVAQGKFRADLFFRINVFPIVVPPLRERMEDIPLLVKHLIKKYSKKIGKDIKSIKKDDLEILTQYNWPGNIRELKHLIERAIIISQGTILDFKDLMGGSVKVTKEDKLSLKSLTENEREHIINALRITKGKVTGANSAAQLLGINGKTLGTKMRKLGITRDMVITSKEK